MKIFEFHFNPGSKPDFIFDSFCYEPSNSQERKLGSLYVIAELKNAIPQNSRLIQNLALLLKREYYFGNSPEQALKKALKKANEFLSERTKTGNVSWLGNLSLAAISLNDYEVAFSKDGKLKTILLRPSQITDIGKTLEIEEFEPYPLKIFTNIISGKFLENDKIMVLTDEIFDLFLKAGFLDKIANAHDQKELKDLFQDKEKEFSDICGICFLIFMSKESSPKSALTFKKAITPLSLKEVFAPVRRILSKLSLRKAMVKLLKALPKISLPKLKLRLGKPAVNLKKLKLFDVKKIRLPKFSLPRLSLKFSIDLKDERARKNLFLISLFAALLILGFLFSKREAEIKMIDFRNRLIDVQEKTVKAQGYLILNQEEKANNLLKEAFKDVLVLAKSSSPIRKEALAVQALIEDNLTALNKIEDVKDPKLVFDFANSDFVPQHLIAFENSLYYFSPYYKGIIRTSGDTLERINADYGFNLAAATSFGLALFSKPDKISFLKDGRLEPAFALELPKPDTVFVAMTSFKDSLYFLEKGTGKIIKYREPFFENADQPRYWIQAQEKKALGAKSLEVTGSVYVLADDNAVWEYRGGLLLNKTYLSVFPFPQKLAKITALPSLSGLAVLEPSQGRIILIDRQGSLIRQFRSEEFLNLKAAAFSKDGRFLYVLSGLRAYQLDLR
ncbi:MAG: hypothetical protein Q8N16_01305 [bacterium]|nr:hypothetical protein [bacterium]